MVIRFENLSNISVTSKLGISNYKTNESTGERLTPHNMMRKTLDVYERRPFVNAGIRQMLAFIAGKGLFAKSKTNTENKKGIDFMNQWLEFRKQNLDQVKFQAILTYLVQGNTYVEAVYSPASDELDNLFTVYDSSRLYYNTAKQSDDDYWLFRVADDNVDVKDRNGKFVTTAEYTPYKYSPSSVYFDENIRAFTMTKDKIFHLRDPYTMDGYYGYSFMMSTIDDEEAINKIIRNIITISSNKAVGKKIIGFWNENGKSIPESDIEGLQDQIDFDVGSNLIVNKKFQVEDLAHTGTYDTMISEIEYLTKDVGSGLSPSYMTPWNSDVNRATAEQARLPFIVNTEKIKKIIETFFTDVIIGNLKKHYPFLEDIELTFGETQYFSIEERKEFYGDLYQNNMITFNQYLSMIDMDPVENGDIYMRVREALLDKEYEEFGNPDFDKHDSNKTESLSEALDDYYDYEFSEEEKDSVDNAKKQQIDMLDEVLSKINKHVK